jgi:SAM-dependent methyltransferase
MSAVHQVPVVAEIGTPRALDLLVLDHLTIRAWDRMLFVPCGDGWIVEEAWRRGVRAYACGLDTTTAQVERARQLREVPGKLEFRVWDGRTLPVADAGFDRIVLTVGHLVVSDAVALIPEARRALRADGELYVLHPTTGRAALQEALTQAGLTDPRELLRSDDQTAVLVRARPASDQKIV